MKTNCISLFSAALVICCQFPLFAQEKGDKTLSIGYGYYSLYHMSYESFSGMATVFSFGSVQQESIKSSGVIYASYNSALSNVWLFGATLSYEKITHEYLTGGFLFMVTPVTRQIVNAHFLTLALDNQFRYVRKPNFQMYSGISLGYTMGIEDYSDQENSSNETHGVLNYQLNFVGMRFGNQVAFQLEIGLGFKGIVNGGLSIRL